MAFPRKLSFSKFPEGGLILVIAVLAVLIAFFGGQVNQPLTKIGPDGEPIRIGMHQVNNLFNPNTLTQITKDTSFFAIMAVGMTVVIITGGIDLSVGALYALAAVCGAMVMSNGGPDKAWLGVLVTIGVGILGGALNGAMIVGFNLHPFIITLGTMTIYRGVAFVMTNGQSIGDMPQLLSDLVQKNPLHLFSPYLHGHLPPHLRSVLLSLCSDQLSLMPLMVMIVIGILGSLFLGRMAVGRKMYAIGGNEVASRFSGIRVKRQKWFAYALSGFTAGLSAALALGYYGAGSSGDGDGYELDVIAAAVVGGASLVGGKGTALGAVLGALIFRMISTGMVNVGIPQSFTKIVTGTVLILAVLLDQLNLWLSNRRLLAKAAKVKKEVIEMSDQNAASA
jgi:ribose/xylose/arabinose/galactoside ABC-type transport system permease subunit